MSKRSDLASIRREYGALSLRQHSVKKSPVEQFQQWFDEIVALEKSDPTAMVLSTVDEQGHPDSRVVLLKGIVDEGFIFYTNYLSAKGKQLSQHPRAALNFFWPELMRQVRIRGPVVKVNSAQSDQYFYSRPLSSQISALASAQSSEVASRETLDERVQELERYYQQQALVRPAHWGGYCLQAEAFEFWQGRDNRMHDRIQYYRENKGWNHRRVSP